MVTSEQSISKKKGWKNISAEEYWGHDRRGENNPNYIDGQSMEDYVGFTRKFKKLIKKRDNYICMNCGTHSEKIRLCVHHIDRDKTNSIPENCITLCIICHNLTLKNNEYWMKLFHDKMNKHYGYEYVNDLPVIKINIKEEVK